jgi:hypothetical protein
MADAFGSLASLMNQGLVTQETTYIFCVAQDFFISLLPHRCAFRAAADGACGIREGQRVFHLQTASTIAQRYATCRSLLEGVVTA